MTQQNRQYSDEHLQQAANRAGMSVEELRGKIAAVQGQELHGQLAQVRIDDAKGAGLLGAAGESCKNIDFDIKIFSIKGTVCFTPGSNWRLAIDLTLSVAGIEVANVKYTFSAANTSVCYKYDLLLVSLDVCFGVRGNGCLYTSGKACGFGSCSSWDETIVCFA